MEVALLPIEEMGREILEAIREGLEGEIPGARCHILPMRGRAPSKAYNPRRRQYRSDRFLEQLRALKKGIGVNRLLGVTLLDIYAPGLNFVFGEADPKWGVAILSTHRLRPEFYGLKENLGLYLERCVKEAIHELGHILRLRHCPDPRCVMHFSNSVWEVDEKRRGFCPRCLNLLRYYEEIR